MSQIRKLKRSVQRNVRAGGYGVDAPCSHKEDGAVRLTGAWEDAVAFGAAPNMQQRFGTCRSCGSKVRAMRPKPVPVEAP